MPMSAAMARALEIHKPAPSLPEWKAKQPEVLEESKRLNRNRASLNSDSFAVMVDTFQKAMGMKTVGFDETAGHCGTFHDPQGSDDVVDVFQLRSDLLKEEVRETEEALYDCDLVEYVDGNLDVIYIALGSLLSIGLRPGEIEELFTEVNASNMTKFDENGQPIINGVTPGYRDAGNGGDPNREAEPGYDPTKPVGKVIKSAQYVKADIAGILKRIYNSRTY